MSEKVEIVAELKDLISGKFADINKQIDAMDNKLAKMGDVGGGRSGIMGQVLGANLLTGAITRAGSAILEFGKDSFNAFGKSEQFLTSLTTMFHGNKEEAKALESQLKGFAIQTPFELNEIRDATKMMIAYGSTSGGVVEEMRMLGDISSGVGSSLSEVAYLYGTARTQGRLFAKDIYQFTGRGIPIVKELAKQFKVAESQVMKLVEEGKVGFAELEKAMRSMTSEGGQFAGMMEQQSKTLLGQTSNLADAWDQLKTAIGQSQEGILKNTISWATQMVNSIKEMVDYKNFREEATKNVKEDFKIDKKGFWASVLGWGAAGMGTGDNPIDTRWMAFNENERRFFDSQDIRDVFVEQQGGNWAAGSTMGTEMRFNMFSNQMKGKYDKLSASDNKVQDLAVFMRDLSNQKNEIISALKDHTISSTLAVNELAVINELFRGAKELQKQITESKVKPAQEPKKLEEAAKKNKAVQVIVNIENLVRELTNVNQKATELNRLTTDGTLKALTAAVNDIYTVGQ